MRVPLQARSTRAALIVFVFCTNQVVAGAQDNAFAIVRVARVEEPTPVGRARPMPAVLDTVAGDDLRVTLSKPLSDTETYEARYALTGVETTADELQTLAWPETTNTLVTRAPVIDSWQTRELRIVAVDGKNVQKSTNAYPLRIAPPANATVESISPSIVEFATAVKVTGQGFFAPRDQIKLRIGEIAVNAERVSPLGDWFSAVVPTTYPNNKDRYDAGARNVSVSVWGVPAQIRVATLPDDQPLRLTLWRAPGTGTEFLIAGVALVTGAAIVGLVYLLYDTLQRHRGLVAALLFEPESQTYSLSRAQFFWWTAIIAYGYLFLFFGHGLHQGNWSFPPLEGFAYTFMISLATLLVAQATSSIKGSKGAGAVHPTPADLIVHGGVLAPERVQQLIWTVLAGVGFLWIVIKTYATSAGLPPIPAEMLALMGIRSAGYIGGKLARKPGPIIQRVEVSGESVILKIFGQNLSVNPRVLIDSVELARDDVATLEPDSEHPEFVKALKVTVPEAIAKTPDEWYSRPRVLVLVNEDTQRAEWELELPTVTSIDVSKPDAAGRRVVTASGQNIGAGAALLVPGIAEEIPLVPDPQSPTTRWTATVANWPSSSTEVTVRTARLARVTYSWTPPPPSAPPAAPPASPPQPDPDAQGETHRREGDEAAEEIGTARDT